ncbi:GNAT family N-acetyltransferase [Sphingomonas qomolangmaensis]|uniref:GNAT family N-acetyltransferase n=1 Tax=Sphingomonas qomolangmaensis TaxID=2918765 RepID=A0ABY5L8D5_9SPHN|nr:GNAT family N-acetyltransferase [Sphingomonas qomolangmaensis]UUL82416.1 GNAT family N-acetyltransferase [Sphingomonas qomolangmaensis]
MSEQWQTEELRMVRLSQVEPGERALMLEAYRRGVYEVAFPIADLRENVAYWAARLAHDAPPPQPHLDVILAITPFRLIVGGVTIEHYRTADCGLLTYIAVMPDARGRGVGTRLVAEARRVLTEIAGNVLMFAETERYCDAVDDHERTATIARQRQLAKLGADMLVFDYVMPPLRADSQPHPLHLLVFIAGPGTRPSIPARQVALLLRELAAALETDIEAHPDTRAMIDHLEATDLIDVEPLPGTRFDRQFTESPVLRNLDTGTFSFAFELCVATDGSVERAAVRLEQVQAALEREGSSHVAAHAALVEPVRSFLDDVTTWERRKPSDQAQTLPL